MLQQENENVLEQVMFCLLTWKKKCVKCLIVNDSECKELLYMLQLRQAQRKREEAEARAKELERQVCIVG